MLILEQPAKGYRYSADPFFLAGFTNKIFSEKPGGKHPAGSGNKTFAVMDIGTGNGILAILLANQYSSAIVDAVELQEELCDFARSNVVSNNLAGKVRVHLADARKLKHVFKAGTFDLVVSNPPYRPVGASGKSGAGRLNPDKMKAVARHELAMTLRDLAGTTKYLLKNGGSLTLVHRPERFGEIFAELTRNALEPKTIRLVHTAPGKDAGLVLIHAIKNGKPGGLAVLDPLYIYDNSGDYSAETRSIYRRLGVPDPRKGPVPV